MIALLRGQCVHVDADSVIVDTGGVGYLVRATTGVIQGAVQAGAAEVTIHIHTSVRDDAIQLYGFTSRTEQLVFEQLTTLQGVGPKVAIAILSAFDPTTVHRAVQQEDIKLLQSVPGVGPKVARRIATELRDKLDHVLGTGTTFGAQVVDSGGAGESGGSLGDSYYDARDALVGLGISMFEAERALRATPSDATVDERVRQALGSGATR